MVRELDLILTLTGALSVALVLGLVAQRVRLSPIVGYLLAGVLVGPFTPGIALHAELTAQFAELGVILLMFGVGLRFHVEELLAVRKVAVPGALAQIVTATLLGVLITRTSGWSIGAGIVFGLAVSVASTVVLMRVLSDAAVLDTPAGRTAVGWLIVEDLFTVLVLVLLPLLAGGTGGSPARVAAAIGLAVAKIALLVALAFVVGRRVIPAFLGWVMKTGSRELFTLAILVIALGVAVGAAELFGASMALGAFLAGLIVGQSSFAARAAADALPMRDAFAVLFFVSVGMQFDPSQLWPNAGLVLATLALVLIGKPITAYVTTRALGSSMPTALTAAAALAQIGEFSFILGALGQQLGVVPKTAGDVLVIVAMISIAASPLLFRLATTRTARPALV